MGDLPRIADRDAMKDYRIAYYGRVDPSIATPILSGPVGAGFNALTRLEVRTGRMTTLPMQPQSTMQEPVHIPSAQPSHEGYLAFLVDRHDENLAEIHIVEASQPERGPIARGDRITVRNLYRGPAMRTRIRAPLAGQERRSACYRPAQPVNSECSHARRQEIGQRWRHQRATRRGQRFPAGRRLASRARRSGAPTATGTASSAADAGNLPLLL